MMISTMPFSFAFVFVFLRNNPTPEFPEEEETMERTADWTGVLYYRIFPFSFSFSFSFFGIQFDRIFWAGI